MGRRMRTPIFIKKWTGRHAGRREKCGGVDDASDTSNSTQSKNGSNVATAEDTTNRDRGACTVTSPYASPKAPKPPAYVSTPSRSEKGPSKSSQRDLERQISLLRHVSAFLKEKEEAERRAQLDVDRVHSPATVATAPISPDHADHPKTRQQHTNDSGRRTFIDGKAEEGALPNLSLNNISRIPSADSFGTFVGSQQTQEMMGPVLPRILAYDSDGNGSFEGPNPNDFAEPPSLASKPKKHRPPSKSSAGERRPPLPGTKPSDLYWECTACQSKFDTHKKALIHEETCQAAINANETSLGASTWEATTEEETFEEDDNDESVATADLLALGLEQRCDDHRTYVGDLLLKLDEMCCGYFTSGRNRPYKSYKKR